MSYFTENYDRVKYPIETGELAGLRRGQLGAIHRIGAHFTLSQEPAVISLPTGAGKTAVLILTPYLLLARRVLVVTPSRLVRSQIAEEFRTLRTVKAIGALGGDCPNPSVREAEQEMTQADWAAVASSGDDVVIGTPNAVSPGMPRIPAPPPNLFDVILVDEAHHSPAYTWNELLMAFPEARRVLFTATPFRRDAQEIKGQFVYTYPVAEAFKDGVFGPVAFVPVLAEHGTSDDTAIARAAEQALRADRDSGLKHAIMVRTDTKSRASQLHELYSSQTKLDLRVIHSNHSSTYVKRVISELRKGSIDGIIAVNMLGEGFDFPRLKIAAVHSPHKSLAATLQFIGRFARTNDPDVGGAKFLAIPSDVQIEAKHLYEEGAVWQQIVPDLLHDKIEEEVWTREMLATFSPSVIVQATADDISLHSLTPYFHVKVYRVADDVDLTQDVSLQSRRVIHRELSHDLSALVLIAQTHVHPRWSRVPQFDWVENDLFIVHHHSDTGLLFLCASRRSEPLYAELARAVTKTVPRPLPPDRVQNAMAALQEVVVFNLGMQNRALRGNAESYRIVAGRTANKSIRKSDALLYDRGHAFGKGKDGDEQVTIGTSTASIVWSNKSDRLPQLVSWCDKLAHRLSRDETLATNTELDYLKLGHQVGTIPDGVIAAVWDGEAYQSPRVISHQDPAGVCVETQLLDLEFVVDRAASNHSRVRVLARGEDFELPMNFTLDAGGHFEPESGVSERVVVEYGHEDIPLTEYLGLSPLRFMFADWSSLVGNILYPPADHEFVPFSATQVEGVDWDAENVDVQVEAGVPGSGKQSVQDYVEARLASSEMGVVFFDDGPGELADFVAVSTGAVGVNVDFYHCKAAGAEAAGDRVDDAYEVAAQTVKGLIWLHREDELVPHAQRRLRRKAKRPSRFVRGDIAELESLVADARKYGVIYRMVIVQPGLSRAAISPKIANILGAAADYLRSAGCEDLQIWASA
jgi:superfamily II DNA or RNA helicase